MGLWPQQQAPTHGATGAEGTFIHVKIGKAGNYIKLSRFGNALGQALGDALSDAFGHVLGDAL